MTTTMCIKKFSYVKLVGLTFVIIALLMILVLLIFNNNTSNRNDSNAVSHQHEHQELHKRTLKSLVTSFLLEHPEIGKVLNEEDDTRLVSRLKQSMPQILKMTEDLQDITEYWIIYPHKIKVPLHKDDLLYESKRNFSSALKLDYKYPHHETGHYRNKSSKIWDPHPQYEIDVENIHNFVLRLQQEQNLLAPKLKVTHVWNDRNLRRPEEQHEHYDHEECQYHGTIENDEKSSVAVSLCNGMQGYFRTSKGSFFIEPIQEYVNENKNILHLLYRRPRIVNENGDVEECAVTNSHGNNIHHETDEEIVLKMLNETEKVQLPPSRSKRSIQSGHQLTPYEQDLHKKHAQRYLERKNQEHQQTSQLQQSRSHHNNQKSNSIPQPHRDVRNLQSSRYQQIQLSPQSAHQRYLYQYDSQNSMINNQKPSETNDYTIEVLVAVDKKMREYHGKNLENYVLTLMSVVSTIYADASIGNSIKIAVVHIMYIEHDLVPDASSGNGVSASGMLMEFCRLKNTHDYQHDTALLLTREQICHRANLKRCDTLGLAELGTMCKKQSCAIVQDNGLSAAFTIAHELGHVLNMPHDDDKRCDVFRGNTSHKQNIMSRMLDHNTHPWSWSKCSRHYATEFLENEQCNCLLDKPHHNMININDNKTLAGEKFTDDQQCELVFGPGATICSYMPTCSRLWCTTNLQEGCRTQHMPWADGTKCGEDQWCQKGHCVPRNRATLVPIDGNWGDWSEFGQCSRSCGGGVQSRFRDCNSPSPANGGKYCVGQRIEHRTCNIQECENELLDFRAEQCSRFDNNSFNIENLYNAKWMPKNGLEKKDECKLYCRVEQTATYFELKNRVIDGTPCSYHTFDKCINGECIPAGCDNELYSTAELDMCGVCKGHNETCETFHGNLTYHQFRISSNYQSGYFIYPVATIPKGATNIEINQGIVDDQNYISLRDNHDRSIINDYRHIDDVHKTLYYGGITLDYNGGKSAKERVNSTYTKQLKRELKIYILSFKLPQPMNEEYIITYSYSRSNPDKVTFVSNHVNHNSNDYLSPAKKQYEWHMQDWSNCSKLCQGKQTKKASCVESNTKVVVNDGYCRNSAKPYEEFKECNTDCRLIWESRKSNCSVTCGDGNRTIEFQCVQQFNRNGGYSKIVDKSHCQPRFDTKLYEPCSQHCNEVLWAYEKWSSCSRSCGGGKQNRTYFCISDPVHRRAVADKYCSHLRREQLVRYCNQNINCAEWAYGEESPCSVSCGIGIRNTVIYCKQNNELVNPSLCASSPRPKENIKSCVMPQCDAIKKEQKITYTDLTSTRRVGSVGNARTSDHTSSTVTTNKTYTDVAALLRYEWKFGPWGECSVKCGETGGTKIRTVRCIDTASDYKLVEDQFCDPSKRPSSMQHQCNALRCPTWAWGSFGNCTNECKRERQVVCQDHRGKTSDQCPLDLMPHKFEACCHFRWRTTWKPCCESGFRAKEPICWRLYPRSPDNPFPVKNGTRVNEKYCEHLPNPKHDKTRRICKRKAPCVHEFRWVVGGWQKCTSGCGVGYSVRNVTCSNGVIENSNKCKEPRPIKYKQCENKSHCRWRTGRWRSCTCAGLQKRKITCWDGFKNIHSNSCPANGKPHSRQSCKAPPNCSCKSIQIYQKTRKDGEYKINIRGREVEIYCHNMNTENPKEYLTLKRGNHENYALFYSKRSTDSSKCDNAKGVVDDSIQYGTTRYSRIRININSLQVIDDDFTFTHTVGKPQTYATGGDCYHPMKCPQGEFFVNLEGTDFHLRKSTTWESSGTNSTLEYQIKLEKPFQKVRARCGGYCGTCRPARGIYLDVL